MPNENKNTESEQSQAMRPLDEAISELSRELQVRERCYGRWISDGKMSRIDAVDRYARLQSALVYLKGLVPAGDSGEPLTGPVEQVPF